MDRRRALLAASMDIEGGTYDEIFGNIPPESTSFDFPLYITVPFDRNIDSSSKYVWVYSKKHTVITEQLFNWFYENAEVFGSGLESYYDIYEPDIYINGLRVLQMSGWESHGMKDSIELITNYEDYSMQIFLDTYYEVRIDIWKDIE